MGLSFCWIHFGIFSSRIWRGVSQQAGRELQAILVISGWGWEKGEGLDFGTIYCVRIVIEKVESRFVCNGESSFCILVQGLQMKGCLLMESGFYELSKVGYWGKLILCWITYTPIFQVVWAQIASSEGPKAMLNRRSTLFRKS